MKKEDIIYNPEGEGPGEKQAAKDYEKEYLEARGYKPSKEDDSSKYKESQPSLLSREEAVATVRDAREKGIKASRGIMEAEFKDWWLGKNGSEGGKKLAEWVFEELFSRWSLFMAERKSKLKNDIVDISKNIEKFKDVSESIEPHLLRLVGEIIKYGGQEHIRDYFLEEWRPKENPDVREKIWKIYQKYLENVGGKV